MMRGGWGEVLEASLYGDSAFGINDVQLEMLRAATAKQPLEALIAEVYRQRAQRRGRRAGGAVALLENGALDILA